jgi:hypothetical protein
MEPRFLLPHQMRPLGWILALPGCVLGYLAAYKDFKIPHFGINYWPRNVNYHGPVYQDLTNTLALTLIIAGLFFVAFSREKKEDELTARMRYNALYWAVLINYLIYLVWLIATLAIGLLKLDMDPLGSMANVLGMSIYNLFTPLLIFIARYAYLRYSSAGEYKPGKVFYLPEKPFKLIGKAISVPLVVIVFFAFFGSLFFKGADFEPKDWLTVMLLFLPLTLMIWGYSKRSNEDEFISTLRLESMQLAVYINYSVLLLANFFFYFTDFMVLMFLNLGTIALFFVLRFNYILRRYNMQTGKGELAV